MPRLYDRILRRGEDPKRRLVQAGVVEGTRLADVGAGYGFYAVPAAKMVGATGVVYAVEPDPKRAAFIRKLRSDEGISNLRIVQAGAERMDEIPSGSVDIAISISSLHHFADPSRALAEVTRIVRPGGSVYVRDRKPGGFRSHGTTSEEFRRIVAGSFPGATFEEERSHITARASIPSG